MSKASWGRRKFSAWPDDAVGLSVDEVVKAYESGLIGAGHSPEALEQFRSEQPYPDADEVCHAFGLADTGAGKLVVPFVWALDVFPGCWPATAQETGDCTKADAIVRMADGTTKRIADVRIGEMVVSAKNKVRRVEAVIRKPFDGQMVRVQVHGHDKPLELTPDHLVIVCEEGVQRWVPIGEVKVGEHLLLPRGVDEEARGTKQITLDMKTFCSEEVITPEGSRNERIVREDGSVYRKRLATVPEGFIRFKHTKGVVREFVPLDEKLAWLLGIYLAEGSMDVNHHGEPRRITLNLGEHRHVHAEQAREYFRELFGVEVSISQVPSKPTVLYVRCGNVGVASLFGSLCPGNVYSKRVPKEIMQSRRSVRLAFLRGWFDGDGHVCENGRGTAGSTSFDLARGMFEVANSCGLRVSSTDRPQRGRSKPFKACHFPKESLEALYEGEAKPATAGRHGVVMVQKRSLKRHVQCDDGIAARVTSTERFDWTDDVHCLVVEEDHSFIADGYAVHNCVSHSQRNAMLATMSCDIVIAKPDEKTGVVEGPPDLPAESIRDGVLSTEVLYWYRGHGGQGWYCPGAASIATKTCGMVLRQNHPELGVDLSRYNVRNATKYGAQKPPAKVAEIGGKHLVHEATEASSADAVRDLLWNGYGVSTCGGEGYGSTRDENGVSRRSGSWAHAMAAIGFDDRDATKQRYGGPLVLILNSWGPSWNRGPREIPNSAEYVPATKKQDWTSKGIVAPSGNILIPEGSFWTPWGDASRREFIAMSGVNGWPRKELPWPDRFI